MPIRNVFALLSLGVVLAACVASGTREEAPMALSQHNFEYSVADREGVQLVQAFDDGSKTYLQFTRAPAEPVVIEGGADKKPLAYLGDGPYLVVAGVYPQLAVTVGAHSALITNDSETARAAAVSGATPAQTQTSDTGSDRTRSEALQGQIGALQARITQLQSELAEAHAAGRAAMVSIGASGASPRIVIRFGNNSSVVELDTGLLQALGNSAMAAKRVYLHGRTDSFVLSATAAELAVSRAVTVKRLLVAQGVDADHIRIFYRGAGGFATDNATSAGKAANRRVEIQMIKG
jgi:outer membrane protein OmpA-like peptidoglycan-associated protein